MTGDSWHDAVSRARAREDQRAEEARRTSEAAQGARMAEKRAQVAAIGAANELVREFRDALIDRGWPGSEVVTVRRRRKLLPGTRALSVRRVCVPDAGSTWHQVGHPPSPGFSVAQQLVVGPDIRPYITGWAAEPLRAEGWDGIDITTNFVVGLREMIAHRDAGDPRAYVERLVDALATWTAREGVDISLKSPDGLSGC